MTASAALQLTKAEQALVNVFINKMGSLPGNAQTLHSRDKAIATIKKNGLPTRRVEAWHYTDLRRLLQVIPADLPVATAGAEPLLASSAQTLMLNGHVSETTQLDGVSIKLASEAFNSDTDVLSTNETALDDAVSLINSAFVTDGIDAQIAVDTHLSKPIEMLSVHDGGHAHTRNSFHFGAGSSCTVIDRYLGSSAPVLASNFTHIHVGEGANIVWVRVQDQGSDATHLGKLNITLEADAKLSLFILNFGGQLVREEVAASMAGEGAEFTFRAINLLNDTTHCDVTLMLDHLVPNTRSVETVRNVIAGKAQGVFQGQIKVAKIAQKTDAQMACNTLLLSDDAGISVKPELEIFADDVICAHGATVTEINTDHLFYLMARGITEKTARSLLVNAFVAQLVEELENEELVEALETRIDTWLEALE